MKLSERGECEGCECGLISSSDLIIFTVLMRDTGREVVGVWAAEVGRSKWMQTRHIHETVRDE